MAEKIGQVFWSANFYPDTGKFEWDEYVLRTIRGGKAFATQKNDATWGKRSKKHGDFGWLDPINPMWRRSWSLKTGMPTWMDLHTTKLAALRAARKGYEPGDFDTDELYQKAMKTLDSMITKHKGKKKRMAGG